MAITVSALQAQLAKFQQGDTFTLQDTALGITGVQQLFDQYLPSQTLTLQSATADQAALTVTGQLTLDTTNANLVTVAQFLTDDQQVNVTGIVITAQVTGWSFQTSFLTFSNGSALQNLGFTGLAVVLSAQPDDIGNVAPATGIGATLPFTGSGGAVSLQLAALLPDGGSTDPFTLQATFPAVALGGVAGAGTGLPAALVGQCSFDVVPSMVPVDSSKLALTGFLVTVSPSLQNPVVLLSATVYLSDTWPLLPTDPTFAELQDIEASLSTSFPSSTQAAEAYLTVTGALQLPGSLEIIAGFSIDPELDLLAELPEQPQPVSLAPFIEKYLPAAAGDPTLANLGLTEGLVTVGFSPFNFNLQLGISDPIQITDQIAFENLYLMLNGGSGDSMGGGAYATFDIDGVDVQVGASYASDSGWQFVGRTVYGAVPPGGTEAPAPSIDIGMVITMLGEKFGWTTVPAAISSMVLTNLSFEASSGTKSFQFEVDGTFALANATAAFTLQLQLSYDSTTSKYSGGASAELTLTPTGSTNQLVFDVSFEESGSGTQFTATWKDVGSAISLTDIATALGFQAPDIPSGLDLSLTGVSFTYDTDPSSQTLILSATSTHGSATFKSVGAQANAQYSFSLDVDETIDLSNLPLVGKALSDVETASLDQIQIQLASASPTTSSSASLTLVLDLGGQTTPVTLSMGGTPAGGSGQSFALAATGSGTSSSDGVTWFNVQQAFGPVTIDQVGLKYEDSVLWALLTATMSGGGLTVVLNGLSVGMSISSFSPQFNLDGLTIQYTNPPVEIGGSFLQVTPQAPVTLQFNGGVTIGTPDFTITGYGSYAVVNGQPSLFIFAEVASAFGGPPAFFITGLAGGFGFNSQLALPALSQVATFPMVAALPGTSNYNPSSLGGSAQQPPTPLQALQALTGGSPVWITPTVGEYWGALGLTFTTYDLVKSQALLIVEEGNELTVSLLGTSTAQFPQSGGTLYAWVQLDLEAEFAPAQGVFWLEAVLAPNSFLFSSSCLLSGGFAFSVWYGPSPYAGDFVVTIGGYNPGFDPPSYYPNVPRVGFQWQLDSTIDISGDAYLALTPSMLMVGGALDVVYQSGRLKAWLDLYADVLVRWNPFWFEADFGVSVGASYALHIFGAVKTITAELGASVALWGPPTGGTVTVKWHIFKFTIDFGTPLDASQSAQQATWDDVVATLPNTGTTDSPNILGLNPVSGVNPPPAQPAASQQSQQDATLDDDTDGPPAWSVRGATFAFTTSTSVPASQVNIGKATTLPYQALNVAPLYVSGGTSIHTLTIEDGDGNDKTGAFTITPVMGNASSALFGQSGDLSVPSGDGQLVPNQVVGLSCVANPPTLGYSAGAVSVQQVLAFNDLALAGAVMPLSASASAQGDVPANSDGTVSALTDPNGGIASTAIAGTRTTLFNALSTLGYGPGSNDALSQFATDVPNALNAQPLLVTDS